VGIHLRLEVCLTSERISCLFSCDVDMRMHTKIWLTFLRIRRALCHDFCERGGQALP